MTNHQYNNRLLYLFVSDDEFPLGRPISKPKKGWAGDLVPIAQVIANPSGPLRAYDIEEFCRLMGISRATFYRQVNSGVLLARKIQGKVVITFEDAMDYLRNLPKVVPKGGGLPHPLFEVKDEEA